MTGTVELVSTYTSRVVRLAEADRVGGTGPVSIRIRASGGALDNPAVEWVRVVGTELRDGGDVGELDVLVRAKALRAALVTAGSRHTSPEREV